MKNLPCSPTTSCLTPTVLNHSRCTTCSTASANTPGTRGIAIFPRPPWTSGGKMRLETLSLSTTRTALLNFFMNILLIGLRAKNSVFYFRTIFDISRLTISPISCAWAAMRPSQTATCFHKADKKGLCFLLFASSSNLCSFHPSHG